MQPTIQLNISMIATNFSFVFFFYRPMGISLGSSLRTPEPNSLFLQKDNNGQIYTNKQTAETNLRHRNRCAPFKKNKVTITYYFYEWGTVTIIKVGVDRKNKIKIQSRFLFASQLFIIRIIGTYQLIFFFTR